MSNKYPGSIVTSGAPAGYSVAFDGTGDYLSLADNAAFALGSGDFTIECWAYTTAWNSQYNVIICQWNSGTSFIFRITSALIGLYANISGTQNYTASVTNSLNVWDHFCVTRSGGTLTFYKNGASVGTAAISGTIADVSDNITIGILGDLNSTTSHTGYISNLRLIKGAAVAPSLGAPTQLFAVTNTSLLTCNSPAIVDQSSNAFTITANGNAAVSTFTPFQGYVAYNPALGAATPGIWSVSDAIQAAQTRRWNMYDPYFNYTTLLLHGNYTGSVDSSGTAVYQNNTFLDSSSNNFTITRNGNTTQGTFSPFSQTGWSNYFASSSGFRFADSADFSMGTNAFTIECFVYLTKTQSAGSGFISQWVDANDANSSWQLGVDWSGGSGGNKFSGQISIGGTVTTVNDTTNYSLNTWHHVVLCRSGSPGTTALFVDGVRVATSTVTGSIVDATNPVGIGVRGGSDSYYMDGVYISNVRVINGSDIYGATNSSLTVPTAPLTAVTNTKLLTCQSNRFLDANTQVAAKAVSQVLGTPSVQAFSPFLTNVAYTPTVQGGSGYFDGSGDYLTAASNAAFAFGTGDFTWEAWIYRSASATQEIYTTMVTNGFIIYISSNKLVVRQFGVADRITSSADVALNTWTHVAVARSGTTMSLWLNGSRTSGGTATNSNDFAQSGIRVGINDATSNAFTGYISGLRAVKGTAVYDPTQTTITVPTAPPTAITNTQLLLNFTNGGIIDATAKNVLETVGNAQISTAQSKFGGSSMYFDGTGDYLQIPDSNLFISGTENFTVEMWVYLTASGTMYIAGQCDSGGSLGSQSIAILKTSTEKLQFYGVSGTTQYICTSSANLSLNTWTHIACVRNGSTLTQYINGVADGTASISTASINNSSNKFGVGTLGELTSSTVNGYIDDFRITKGYARYTGNFTPQTSQWQDQ